MPSALSSWLAALDARIFLEVYGAAGGAFTGLAVFLSAIGSGWSMFWLLLLYAVPRWRRLALTLTATLLVSAALVYGIKALVGRVRPCACLPGVHALCAMPTDPSFPSGHACGSFTVAAFVVFAMYGGGPRPEGERAARVLAVGLFLLATAIAWSRVYLGVHFPGDVTVGGLLGIAVGGTVVSSSDGELERPPEPSRGRPEWVSRGPCSTRVA